MKIILEIPDDAVEMKTVFLLDNGKDCGVVTLNLNRTQIQNARVPEPRPTESYFLSARTEETYNSQHCTFDE